MKKAFSVLMISIMILLCVTGSALAAETGMEPRYNNISVTNTSFTIEDGEAIVICAYRGTEGVTTNVRISITLQKKVLFFFWDTLDTYTVSFTKAYHTFEYSYATVSSGTYRAIIEYTISGTGGEDDVITRELEKSI